MPANLVTGGDAEDVATYVALVAGRPVAAKSTTSGKDIFTANCGSCHTLKDAGTTGNVGPNLDQLKPSLGSCRTGDNGGGAMPAFKGTLTEAQIMAVATYVSSVAGRLAGAVAEVHHDVVDRHRVALGRARTTPRSSQFERPSGVSRS